MTYVRCFCLCNHSEACQLDFGYYSKHIKLPILITLFLSNLLQAETVLFSEMYVRDFCKCDVKLHDKWRLSDSNCPIYNLAATQADCAITCDNNGRYKRIVSDKSLCIIIQMRINLPICNFLVFAVLVLWRKWIFIKKMSNNHDKNVLTRKTCVQPSTVILLKWRYNKSVWERVCFTIVSCNWSARVRTSYHITITQIVKNSLGKD